MRALALVSLSALAGCNVTTTTPHLGIASFKVNVTCAGTTATDCPAVPAGTFDCPTSPPPNLGTPLVSVDRDQLFYMAQVQAMDANGVAFPDYQGTANVYIQFEGSVTPTRGALIPPLATLPFKNGRACLSLPLPPAFNETTIWVEDPTSFVVQKGVRLPNSSFAVGASETIYRPAPLVSDVQFTSDPVEQTSALNNKHVIIANGAGGAPMIVTYVSTNYFTVTDLGAPGVDHPWGSIELYTYSQPFGIQVGSIVSHLNGSVQNFLGLPELNFPVWTLENNVPGSIAQPNPHRILHSDIPNILGAMAPYKSGPVSLVSDATDTWVVCALRGSNLASYQKYGEWLVAGPTSDCSSFNETLDVVTTASIPNFDPIANSGKKICRLDGILTVVVPAPHVNLWTVTPRNQTDLGAVVNLSDPCP